VKPIHDLLLLNRTNPPDAILREVDERTGGNRFNRIDEVIHENEMAAICRRYQQVAGFDKEQLRARPALFRPLLGDFGSDLSYSLSRESSG
jgi:hypothetical protein